MLGVRIPHLLPITSVWVMKLLVTVHTQQIALVKFFQQFFSFFCAHRSGVKFKRLLVGISVMERKCSQVFVIFTALTFPSFYLNKFFFQSPSFYFLFVVNFSVVFLFLFIVQRLIIVLARPSYSCNLTVKLPSVVLIERRTIKTVFSVFQVSFFSIYFDPRRNIFVAFGA